MSRTTTSGGPGNTDSPPEQRTALAVDVAAPEEPVAKEIVGRSPGQLAWQRLKRDRVSMICGSIVLLFVVVAVLAPVIKWIYGEGPNDYHSNLLDSTGLPLGYVGGIDFTSNNPSHHIHILGVQPGTGRDVFMQLVYGTRTSLLVAVTGSLLALILGVIFGVISGYFGGWIDSGISWVIDFMLAFPFLLFALAAIPVINTLIADQSGDVSATKRIVTLILLFSLFTWMGTARLVRGQVLSLREREYVEAARAAGASVWHIMFRQILPNLWAPILVTISLLMPALVTGEAALSFLNIGVIEPTPDWGRMVNDSINWMRADPIYTFSPGFLLLVLVLTFNLFGDGLRDALDPKSTR